MPVDFTEQVCSVCNKKGLVHTDDYMCVRCRAEGSTYHTWEPHIGTLLNIIIDLWPGYVIVRDGYEDPEHGWVEVGFVDPVVISSADIIRGITHNKFAIWKSNGDIYRIGLDGAVEDDPTSLDAFLAMLEAGVI